MFGRSSVVAAPEHGAPLGPAVRRKERESLIVKPKATLPVFAYRQAELGKVSDNLVCFRLHEVDSSVGRLARRKRFNEFHSPICVVIDVQPCALVRFRQSFGEALLEFLGWLAQHPLGLAFSHAEPQLAKGSEWLNGPFAHSQLLPPRQDTSQALIGWAHGRPDARSSISRAATRMAAPLRSPVNSS